MVTDVPLPQALFGAIFRESLDAIVVADDDARIIAANGAAERLFGMTPGALTGRRLRDFVTPDEHVYDRWQRMTEGAEPRTALNILQPDGTLVPVESTSMAHVLPGMHIGMIRDMRAQRAVEDELRASEERYRAIVENASDMIFTMGLDGGILTVNDACERITGYRAEEMVGSHLGNLITTLPRPTAGRWSDDLAGETGSTTCEVDFRDKSGRPHVLEVTSQVAYRNGAPLEFHGIARDVTERSLAERALRESEERLRTVVENAPFGAWIFDGARSTYVNPALEEITGFSADFLTAGDNFALIFTPEGAEELVERGKRRILGEPEPDSYSLEIVHADGTLRMLEARAVSILIGGQPATLVFVLDVTARRRSDEDRRALEQKVQQAQKFESLGILAGGIAHDFNNLLVSILGNSDIALSMIPADSNVNEVVTEIQVAAWRAAELTRQMLAYSGRGRFVIETLDLSVLTFDMAQLLEASVSGRAEVRFELAYGLPQVSADAAQLRQVIASLVTNAAEAMPGTSGDILISTGLIHVDRHYLRATEFQQELEEGTYVYIEVKDTGSGMDAATRDRVFDPFFTTKFTGRGLGLAAVLGIVRGHKGAIKVDSEPGVGTTFKVLFPAHFVSRSTAADSPPNDSVQDLEGATILVIDDDASVRMVASRMLTMAGFRVIECDGGACGLLEYQRRGSEISLVLLDLTMPEMNGEVVFEELRRIDPGVRVLLTSGYAQADATTHFAGKELAGFVQKPFGRKDLLSAVQRVLMPRSSTE